MLGSIALYFMTEACRGWNDQKLNVLCQKEARLVSWISGQRADCFSLLIWRYLGTQHVYSFHVVHQIPLVNHQLFHSKDIGPTCRSRRNSTNAPTMWCSWPTKFRTRACYLDAAATLSGFWGFRFYCSIDASVYIYI